MVLMLGIHFPENRPVLRALCSFYGIGQLTAAKLMAKHYIMPLARMGSLENKTVLDLTADLTGMTIENEARRQLRRNIERLRDIKCYRGMRHALGLPVRGQSTQTQIRTAKKLNKLDRKG